MKKFQPRQIASEIYSQWYPSVKSSKITKSNFLELSSIFSNNFHTLKKYLETFRTLPFIKMIKAMNFLMTCPKGF